jgi:vitamin B12 transporter
MRDTCLLQSIRCFRQWSRKGYALLISLKAIIKIGVLCLSYSLVTENDLIGQDDTAAFQKFEFQEIEITGRRSGTVSSSISRVITIIRNKEIEQAGITDFSDILEYVSNADIRQRGNLGIQADISIRGSSFDHVMILVNGINLSDPQTGHLGLDLPLDPGAIERIEVLEGPAARSLGPGALLGAINIITRDGSGPAGFSLGQTLGDFGLSRTFINTGFSAGRFSNFLSAGRSSSKGYVHNSDHELYNMYYRSTAEAQSVKFDMQAGFQSKKFGAGGFYSPRFPDQYEENSGWFGSLKISSGKSLRLHQHLYWRRRNDRFLLDRSDPSLYENFHLTDVYGSQFNLTYGSKLFTSNAGIDLRSENILSNNIGYEIAEHKKVRGTDSSFYNRQYQRTNFSLFAEENFSPGKWDITAGLMVNWNTGFHGKASVFPGIEVSYISDKGYTIFSNFNRAVHLPTFTDLFYSDPQNQGNLELEPNRIIAFEGGLKFNSPVVNYQAAAFYNYGNDIVDWLWNNEGSRFSPVNLERYRVLGFSSNFSADLSVMNSISQLLHSVSLSYMYLSIDKSAPEMFSKYYNLKHKFSAVISQKPVSSLLLTWRISYQDRYGDAIGYEETAGFYSVPYNPYWLIDGIIKWKIGYFEMYAEVSNILNTRYIDAGSGLQPGRWLKAGLIFSAGFKESGNHRKSQ